MYVQEKQEVSGVNIRDLWVEIFLSGKSEIESCLNEINFAFEKSNNLKTKKI